MGAQPYIFKKQITVLCCTIVITVVLYVLGKKKLYIALLMYSLVILFMTFIPSLRKKKKYPIVLHSILYYAPLYCSSIIPNYIDVKFSVMSIYTVITILGCIILILCNFRVYKETVSGFITKIPITLQDGIETLFNNTLALLSEEIFFRFFIIGFLRNDIGFYTILLSTFFFVLSHYVNRWANVQFILKNYIFIFLLGFLLGIVFYYSHNLLICIIGHFIYNSGIFIRTFKRLKIKTKENILFDDYQE